MRLKFEIIFKISVVFIGTKEKKFLRKKSNMQIDYIFYVSLNHEYNQSYK